MLMADNHGHYVYYSYEEYGRGYIGSRTCPKGLRPEEDVSYLGSFRDKTFNPTNKIILKTYATRDEALKAEIFLHKAYNVASNKNFANIVNLTSTKFNVIDSVWYNNGEKEIFLNLDTFPPDGFSKGRLNTVEIFEKRSMAKRGNKNTLGFFWCNDGERNLFLKETEEIPEGFRKGLLGFQHSNETKEKISKANKGKRWYNNGEKNIILMRDEEVPEGFVKGLCEKTKTKISKAKRNMSDETKTKISEANKDKKLSEEHKKKISKALKNTVYYNNGEKNILLRDDMEIPDGFVKGRLKLEK